MRPRSVILCLAAIVCLAAPAVLAAAAAATSFAPAVYYRAGIGPQALAVVDVNGDGKADIVTANDDGMRLLIGNGRGRFAAPVRIPSGFFTTAVTAADFNIDGNPDLATVDSDGALTALLGDGLGGFTAGPRVTGAGGPLVVADFNGDAKPDVATTRALLLGDGAGGFSFGDPPPVGSEPRGLATADFNRDGKADLVVTNDEWCGDQDTRILLGDGAGHFTDGGVFPSFLEPGTVLVGDLNGDDRQDVVTAESLEGDQVLEVLLGDGSGGFTEGAGARLGCTEVFISVLGDFDGDGRLDAAGTGRRGVVVLRGNGHGGFLKPERFPAERNAGSLVAADFNRDGLLDLATADYQHDAVAVLLNGPRVAPVLESLTPRRGPVGALVTLVGAHFGARRGAGVVKFGAAIATKYVSWSAAKIRVRVPDGTLKGWVKVRVQTVAGRSAAEAFLRL